MLELGDGTRKVTSNHSLAQTYTKSNSKWLVHSLSTFGVKTSHKKIRIHKIHHGSDSGEATTFLLILYFVPSYGTSTQMSLSQDFQVGVPKFPQLGLP